MTSAQKLLREDTKYPFDERNYYDDRKHLLVAGTGFRLKKPGEGKFAFVVEVMEDVIIYIEERFEDRQTFRSGQMFAQVDDLLNDGWCCD